MSLVYPPIFLLTSLGLKNLKQEILCFISTYFCLLILFVLKNFFLLQIIYADNQRIYYLLAISYNFSILFVLGLILSNITFSKINKGLTGLIFSIIYLCGFILLYHSLNGSTKIFDALIIYSLVAIIINYNLLRGSVTRSDLTRVQSKNSDVDEFIFDVFISYRRNKNADAAKLIRTALNSRNISAFLDIEDLGSRFFDERLIEVIRHTNNFVLLISPDDLKNCKETNDWLRNEISTAIQSGRNIIPILKDGFNWDESLYLPEEIRDLPRHNSINYSTEYFEAMIMKLISFLEDSWVTKLKK
jgi:hypothetical protein